MTSAKPLAHISGPRFRTGGATLALAVVLVLAIMPINAQAQTYTVLHAFPGDASQGRGPNSRLIRDDKGNLYGTTFQGGPGACNPNGLCGTVFKLSADNTETVLHTFADLKGGAIPLGVLLQDTHGNFYGTTEEGGDTSKTCGGFSVGCGVVFKLGRYGHLAVLHTFTGGLDGGIPYGLVMDTAGNLYGTTQTGGGTGCTNNGLTGCGVVFKINTLGKFTVLCRFLGGSDGDGPSLGSLTLDSAGNLYGSTFWGGSPCAALQAGCGTIFKIDPTGHETILFRFAQFGQGVSPMGRLLRDSAGNFYGTTIDGGIPADSCGGGGCGVVFKINAAGAETQLHSFTGGADGASPRSGIIRDGLGNFYGVTVEGGAVCNRYGATCGVVFKLDKAGNETVLYTFTGGADGAGPFGGLRRDKEGNLYGTTSGGGETGSACDTGCGVIFKITP